MASRGAAARGGISRNQNRSRISSALVRYQEARMNGPGLAGSRMANFANSIFCGALTRRSFLAQAGIAGLALSASPSFAEEMVELPLASDPRERPITHDFPQKAA